MQMGIGEGIFKRLWKRCFWARDLQAASRILNNVNYCDAVLNLVWAHCLLGRMEVAVMLPTDMGTVPGIDPHDPCRERNGAEPKG